EQLGGSAHGLAAVPQDRNRAIVVPIVNDMLEKISIAAARHLHKNVTAHRFAAVGKTDLVQSRVRALDDLWEIEQSSPQLRRARRISKNADEPRIIAAADVDDAAKS